MAFTSQPTLKITTHPLPEGVGANELLEHGEVVRKLTGGTLMMCGGDGERPRFTINGANEESPE